MIDLGMRHGPIHYLQVSDSRCDVPEGSRSSDFEEAVKQADATPTCATPTDTLFLALHTLMLHSGYRPAQVGVQPGSGFGMVPLPK